MHARTVDQGSLSSEEGMAVEGEQRSSAVLEEAEEEEAESQKS